MPDDLSVTNLRTLGLEREESDQAPAVRPRPAVVSPSPGPAPDDVAPPQPAGQEPVLLDAEPGGPGDVVTSPEGGSYFVPVAAIPTRSRRTRTPAVFLDVDDTNTWVLRVWVDLMRPVGIPDDAQPLAVTDLTAQFATTNGDWTDGQSPDFTTVTELPPPSGTDVLRRIALAVEVRPERAAEALRTDVDAAVVVNGAVAFRLPGRRPVVTDPAVQDELAHRRSEMVAMMRERGEPEEEILSRLEAMVQEDDARFSAGPTSHQASYLLGPGGQGLPVYLPEQERLNRPIYHRWNFASGVSTAGDPDTVWLDSGSGMWRPSAVPNEYYVLPDEYRLAFDVDQGVPAMSVLLVAQPHRDGDSGGGAFKVRVRFKLVPWRDAATTERLRAAISAAESVPYPELVYGGYLSSTFDVSSWLRDLGGNTVAAAPGPVAVDARGFELALDCSMEFYTLLARLLAPGAGTATGLEGSVMLSVRTSHDDQAPPVQREAPVRIRLDRPDDAFVLAEQIPVPLPDPATWPPGWTPPLYARARTPDGVTADVAGVVASMLVVDPLTGTPVDRVPAAVQPAGFRLGPPAAGTPAAVPAAPPAGPDPDGGPPAVGPGEVLLTLTQADPHPVDVRTVNSLAIDFHGVSLRLEPATVLERVHALGTSTGLVASVTIGCYQLKHPEHLPPELAGVFAIDVELRRGGADAVTVTLSRDRSESVADIPFGFADLIAGLRPDQPKFEYRRRNVAAAGPSEFSAWQTYVGRDLHVTPVM